MKINKAIMYIIVAVLVIIICIGVKIYKDASTLKTIKSTLKEYFKSNNPHISAYDFSIGDTRIVCTGRHAYIVEFDMHLTQDETSRLNDLGATVYKDKDGWHAKGFGSGLSSDELDNYKFRCKN